MEKYTNSISQPGSSYDKSAQVNLSQIAADKLCRHARAAVRLNIT